jgi:hypothetical protein
MPLSLALCGLVGLLTLAAARFGPGLVPVPRPEVASGVAGPALGAGLLALSVVLAALVARAGRR